MAGTLFLRLDFGAAGRIDTDTFEVSRASPNLSRNIGTLIGGGKVVASYSDPIWTMVVRLGPLTRPQGQALRTSVGSSIGLHIEDTTDLTKKSCLRPTGCRTLDR